MNKKILISLSVIGAVAALAIGGTIAYFSDVEVSTGNTFTAGELDLVVDSECHYNGNVCQFVDLDGAGAEPGSYVWVGNSSYPLQGTPCACTWLEKDLITGDIFFNYDDVKPGDWGENTISLIAKDNDAYLCGYVKNLVNNDNACNEPETVAGDTTCGNPGPGEGELGDNMVMTIWNDGTTCNNIKDTDEPVLYQGPIGNNNVLPLGQLTGNVKSCFGIGWTLPGTTGNLVQSDSVTGDIGFYIEQVRNNSGFTCPATLPVQ